MRGVELIVEHHFNSKFVGAKKAYAERGPFVVGSSRSANLIIKGESVAGVHAIFEYRHPKWVIVDCGGGVELNSIPIIEHKIDGGEVFCIGSHELYVRVSKPTEEIFVTNKSPGHNYNKQQVVILSKKEIIQTLYINKDEAYGFEFGGMGKELPAPKDSNWIETKISNFTVRQRLVELPEQLQGEKPGLRLVKDSDLRGPTIASFVLFFAMSSLMWFKPIKESQIAMAPSKDENKMVKMIYDSKIVEQLKKESKALSQQQFAAASNAAPANNIQKPVESKQVVAKVITNIKATGISSLIGKIAKRAAMNANVIAAVGESADSKNTGRSIASVGGNNSVAKENVGNSSSFKLSGVGTGGKAGGSGNYKNGTALGGGNIGTGTVGVLEEETSIEGGLDKEVIADFINQRLGQIRYCYERQLSGQPDLHGKVLVKFTISGNGQIIAQEIANSTLKSAIVEGCILRRIEKWVFPAPKGGTTVTVSYPFLFKSIN